MATTQTPNKSKEKFHQDEKDSNKRLHEQEEKNQDNQKSHHKSR